MSLLCQITYQYSYRGDQLSPQHTHVFVIQKLHRELHASLELNEPDLLFSTAAASTRLSRADGHHFSNNNLRTDNNDTDK